MHTESTQHVSKGVCVCVCVCVFQWVCSDFWDTLRAC